MPEATLGASAASEQAIRPLVRRWMLASPVERHALDASFRSARQQFADDPLVRVVDVLRAWDALEQAHHAEARALAMPGLEGPAGTVRDLATLVIGATERRTGKPKEALTRLLPLLHKLVDPPATALLDEELVRAAVAAQEWPTALRLMDAWLFEAAPGDRDAVVNALAALFTNVPEEDLVVALRERSRLVLERTKDPHRLVDALAAHLAKVAVASQDVRLARVLLDEAGPLLGSAGEDIAKLAGDRSRGRVTAHTVGVLLALGSPALQRRSADVVTGMAFGLRIEDTDARLVARDDGGDPAAVERALTELAAEGAAVIVAGIDPRHSARVSAFASEQGLPVLLLTRDGASAALREVFVLGASPEQSVGVLASAMRAEGAKVVAGLGSPISDTAAASQLGDGAFGIGIEASCTPLPREDALRGERVDALVALDGAHCGSDVVELGRSLRAPIAVGLGAMVGVRLPDGSRVASSGIFPVSGERGASDPRLVGWFESGRPVPTWWMALGRDAAVLAVHAVKNLADSASDEDVRARRVEATAKLASAREDLWTSDARGFDDARTLPRRVSIGRAHGSKWVP